MNASNGVSHNSAARPIENPVLTIEFQRQEHRRFPGGVSRIHAGRFKEFSR